MREEAAGPLRSAGSRLLRGDGAADAMVMSRRRRAIGGDDHEQPMLVPQFSQR